MFYTVVPALLYVQLSACQKLGWGTGYLRSESVLQLLYVSYFNIERVIAATTVA